MSSTTLSELDVLTRIYEASNPQTALHDITDEIAAAIVEVSGKTNVEACALLALWLLRASNDGAIE